MKIQCFVFRLHGAECRGWRVCTGLCTYIYVRVRKFRPVVAHSFKESSIVPFYIVPVPRVDFAVAVCLHIHPKRTSMSICRQRRTTFLSRRVATHRTTTFVADPFAILRRIRRHLPLQTESRARTHSGGNGGRGEGGKGTNCNVCARGICDAETIIAPLLRTRRL